MVMISDERSVSDRLAEHGVAHEPGGNGRRHISYSGKPLGLMSAEEAVNLLSILDRQKRLIIENMAQKYSHPVPASIIWERK